MRNTIETKIKTRDLFLDTYENSWNQEKYIHEIDEPEEIDKLGDEILLLLKENQDDLPIDFIIESLTKLGDSPSILYDDNGFFAVVTDGFQSISEISPDDTEMSFYVEKANWKPTVREALKFYLS